MKMKDFFTLKIYPFTLRYRDTPSCFIARFSLNGSNFMFFFYCFPCEDLVQKRYIRTKKNLLLYGHFFFRVDV